MNLALKLFMYVGGLGLVFGFVSKGIPQIIAVALPEAIALTHGLMTWLLGKPAVKAAAIKYRPQIEDLMKQLDEGFKRVFDAVNQAVDDDLDKASDETKTP